MGKVVVNHFISLDGVVEDPDGSGGTAVGGWAFRHGPEAVAGDKFNLGALFDTGVLLLGRTTWEFFSKIFPGRTDDFADRMNAVPKLVVSRSELDTSRWENSTLLRGDLLAAARRPATDVIVVGSLSVVHALAAHDLVDEYRLLVLPSVVGAGRRLDLPPGDLVLEDIERKGAGALLRYRKNRGDKQT